MRIIHTLHSARPEAGGPAYSVPSLARAQQDCGAEVELWTLLKTEPLQSGLNCRHLSLSELPAAFKTLDSSNTIIHDHGLWLPWNHAVARHCRKQKLQRIVSPRGMLEPWAMNYRAWKKKLAWMLYQKRDLASAAMLHATAEQEAAHFYQLGLTNKVITAPNGLEPPNLGPVSKTKTILFLSRIHPKKGLLDLVAAWAAIREPGWKIRIVGHDELNHAAEVAAAVAALNLTDCITIEQPLAGEAKWRAYQEAALFVLPSYSENFGMVVAEALSANTPVITTTSTPWKLLIEHQCGWWIDPERAALTQALREAIELTDSQRDIMGQRGRHLIQTHFTWPSIAKRMLEAYTAMLS